MPAALPDRISVDENLVLLPIAPEHAPALFAVVDTHRAALLPFLPWIPHNRSVNDTAAFIADSQALAERGEGKTWVIQYQGDSIGCISFNSIDWPSRTGTVGYWLSPDFHGRGIVSRSLNALLDAAADYGVERCELRCATHNAPSNAVALRCGFHHSGIRERAETICGTVYDHNIYHRACRV